MSYVPLHVHTEHSLLDGLARLKETVGLAAEHGFKAAAITDHGSLAGLWAFSTECKSKGIKPIPGIEAYVAIGSRHDPQTMTVFADDGMGDGDDKVEDAGDRRTKKKSYYHLTILARNRTGWHNLIRLHNESQKTKIGKHPAIDFELLKELGEGLTVLTGCLASPICTPLAQIQFCDDPQGRKADGLRDEARRTVETLIDAVGTENVYVEVMDHGIESELFVLDELLDIADEFDLPVVATNDSHYLHEDECHAHEAFLADGTKSNLNTPASQRFVFNGHGYHYKSEAEMRAVREDDWWQEAVENTQLIADSVAEDTVPEPQVRLPKFPLLPDGVTSEEHFWDLIVAGAADRYGEDWEDDEELVERIEHEYDVITEMGYADYFLIYADIMRFCREEGITTGPGRGSAAGAVTAYCLYITDVEPLDYGLLFERFLERGRVGLPDIDSDFPQRDRWRIHRYCQRVYGAANVAQIGTFGKIKTKGALKGAARTLQPYEPKGMTKSEAAAASAKRRAVFELGNKLAGIVEINAAKSLLPSDLGTIDERITDTPAKKEFWEAVDASPEADHPEYEGRLLGEHLVDLAWSFQDVSTSESVHACGFVISDESLMDMVPMRPLKNAGPEDPWVLTWDGENTESFGLLKMDFLGLQNLDYIDKTFEYLAEIETAPRSVYDIPHPDADADLPEVQAAYKLLQEGRTQGVFQADSEGMTEVIRDIAPDQLNDLSAAVALYRPGPISAGMPKDYASKKHGRTPESYDRLTRDSDEIAALEQVLGETYQNVVYQEQAMRLGQVIAGFDDVQRSTLRKAIGKKKQELMDKCYEWWKQGAPQEITDETGAVVSPAFSESTTNNVWEFIKGSAEYSFNKSHSIAYAMLAYWTAYLKANYPVEYAAAMIATTNKEDKRLRMLADLRAEGIVVSAPDINLSDAGTTAEDGTVRLGLAQIKNVGAAAESIVAERKRGGSFQSLAALAQRVEGLNVTALRALIDSGACDSFGSRRGLLKTVEAVKAAGHIPPMEEEFGQVELDARQRQVLGTIVGEPTLNVLTDDDYYDMDDIVGGEVYRLGDLAPDAYRMCHVGIITELSSRSTRVGRMGFGAIEDSESMRLVLWADTYQRMVSRYGRELRSGELAVVSGTVKTIVDEPDGDDEDAEPRITREGQVSEIWLIPDPTLVSDEPSPAGLFEVLDTDVSREEPSSAPAPTQDVAKAPTAPKARKKPEPPVADEATHGWTLAIVSANQIPERLDPRRPNIIAMQGAPREVHKAAIHLNGKTVILQEERIAVVGYNPQLPIEQQMSALGAAIQQS
ncbi:DNA polymerase III subunit alpha [Nesterenkonia rhizosphaerae]|uniref:DNA-directed DNA polymerase n=1 Tax=Nesterenkonia rhizosphaerae TaxID=1348272 RepID=A0ABP9G0P7_9MICC